MTETIHNPVEGSDDTLKLDSGERLLEILGLKTHFDTRDGVVREVDAVDLHIDRGVVLGVVGESGC